MSEIPNSEIPKMITWEEWFNRAAKNPILLKDIKNGDQNNDNLRKLARKVSETYMFHVGNSDVFSMADEFPQDSADHKPDGYGFYNIDCRGVTAIFMRAAENLNLLSREHRLRFSPEEPLHPSVFFYGETYGGVQIDFHGYRDPPFLSDEAYPLFTMRGLPRSDLEVPSVPKRFDLGIKGYRHSLFILDAYARYRRTQEHMGLCGENIDIEVIRQNIHPSIELDKTDDQTIRNLAEWHNRLLERNRNR